MLTQTEFTKEILRNPLSTQAHILEELQNRITGGKPVMDGNNVFTFLMEMGSTLTADSINAMSNTFPALYPVRAQTSEDLYRHMSTWDYLNLFSRPSDTTISLYLDSDYLINNAKDVNLNYKKVVIPKDTVFSIAGYNFGIHYPIEIRINRSTDSFLVLYDFTETNPLREMKQNTIEHLVSYYAGLNLIRMDIPIFQFDKREVIEELVPQTGFSKTYLHADKFYATRLYHWKNDRWYEIEQTLSDEVYDPRNITAKLHVLQDTHELKITIPQIYFDREVIGTKLKIELYTTKGELDIDISGITQEVIDVVLPKSTDGTLYEYSTILDHIPTIGVIPKSSKIIGGSNGYGFDELSQRVINDTFYGNVLITNDELEKYFEDVKFTVHKYRDGITDRIYYCYKALTNEQSEIVGSGDFATTITEALIAQCSNTIKLGLDNSITILPTTLFLYDENAEVKPVIDSVVATLNAMSKDDLVEEFNSKHYTFNPFHTRLDLNEAYPIADTYDLMKPTIDKVEFIRENVNIISQIVISGVSIEHLLNGSGGYKIQFIVKPSDDLKEVAATDFRILLRTTSSAGGTIYAEAVYKQVSGEGSLLYELILDTNYNISREHDIHTNTFQDTTGFSEYFLPLVSDLDVVCLVKNTIITDPSAKITDVGGILPPGFENDIPVAQQLIQMTLGERIEVLSNGVDVRYTDIEYDTYATDEPKVHDTDIYYRDAGGIPTYTVVEGVPILNIKFRSQDWVYDDYLAGANSYEITCTTVLDSDQVIISNPHNKIITIGMGLSCMSLPVQTKVLAINGNTLTVDKVAIADATDLVGFVDDIIYRFKAGDPKLALDGTPTVVANRELFYTVDMPHVDAKLTKSEQAKDENYVEVVAGFMRTYFETLRAAKDQLIENTRIYYKPMRTMGDGRFRTSIYNIMYLPLELSFHFKLYAENHVINNTNMCKVIRNTILGILDTHVDKTLISYADIVKDIRQAMPDSIRSVDIVGINKDIELQTLVIDDVGTKCSIGRRLVLDENNLIFTERSLDLDFIAI